MGQHHTAKTSGKNWSSGKSLFLLNNQTSLHEGLGHLKGQSVIPDMRNNE